MAELCKVESSNLLGLLDLLLVAPDLGLQLVNQGLEEQAQYVSTVCIYEYKKKIVKRSYLCQYTLGDYILCV